MTNNVPSSVQKTVIESQGITCKKVSVVELWKLENNSSCRKYQVPKCLALQALVLNLLSIYSYSVKPGLKSY